MVLLFNADRLQVTVMSNQINVPSLNTCGGDTPVQVSLWNSYLMHLRSHRFKTLRHLPCNPTHKGTLYTYMHIYMHRYIYVHRPSARASQR